MHTYGPLLLGTVKHLMALQPATVGIVQRMGNSHRRLWGEISSVNLELTRLVTQQISFMNKIHCGMVRTARTQTVARLTTLRGSVCSCQHQLWTTLKQGYAWMKIWKRGSHYCTARDLRATKFHVNFMHPN